MEHEIQNEEIVRAVRKLQHDHDQNLSFWLEVVKEIADFNAAVVAQRAA